MGEASNPLHVIVFANEKGGTGKSTTAVHTAIALAARGARVGCLDLDHRQRTLGRYLDNRLATIKRTGRELPMPRYETHDGESNELFSASLERLSEGSDFLIVDTHDQPLARKKKRTRWSMEITPAPRAKMSSSGAAQVRCSPQCAG